MREFARFFALMAAVIVGVACLVMGAHYLITRPVKHEEEKDSRASWDPNGIKDGDETDIDCGGSSLKTCLVGARCRMDKDCRDKHCEYTIDLNDEGRCSVPPRHDQPSAGNRRRPCVRSYECPLFERCIHNLCRPISRQE